MRRTRSFSPLGTSSRTHLLGSRRWSPATKPSRICAVGRSALRRRRFRLQAAGRESPYERRAHRQLGLRAPAPPRLAGTCTAGVVVRIAALQAPGRRLRLRSARAVPLSFVPSWSAGRRLVNDRSFGSSLAGRRRSFSTRPGLRRSRLGKCGSREAVRFGRSVAGALSAGRPITSRCSCPSAASAKRSTGGRTAARS